MAITNINVRIDEDIKKQAEELLNDWGLNMSTAINVFLRQMIKQQKIPFEISSDPFYSPQNQAKLLKVIKNLEAGQGLVHKDLDELLEMEDE